MAGHLVLTHLWPGTDPRIALAAAAEHYGGTVDIAVGGFAIDLE
ncbi:hypothetical protein [Paractinoplanes atraurantiacus]|nr:hypothetical protein [Actinoplanes atraurantiacus]